MRRLLFFTSLAFFSCVSYNPLSLDLSMNILEGERKGEVGEVYIEENTIQIEDKYSGESIYIRFTGLPSEEVRNSVKQSTEYYFMSAKSPDGPMEHLILSDNNGYRTYLADGIRPGRLPGVDAKFSPDSQDDQSIILSSSEGRWLLHSGKWCIVLINGFSYDAYLLNLIQGVPGLDQPPFQIDLILIRQ